MAFINEEIQKLQNVINFLKSDREGDKVELQKNKEVVSAAQQKVQFAQRELAEALQSYEENNLAYHQAEASHMDTTQRFERKLALKIECQVPPAQPSNKEISNLKTLIESLKSDRESDKLEVERKFEIVSVAKSMVDSVERELLKAQNIYEANRVNYEESEASHLDTVQRLERKLNRMIDKPSSAVVEESREIKDGRSAPLPEPTKSPVKEEYDESLAASTSPIDSNQAASANSTVEYGEPEVRVDEVVVTAIGVGHGDDGMDIEMEQELETETKPEVTVESGLKGVINTKRANIRKFIKKGITYYQCPRCPHAAKTKSHLKVHYRTHVGSKRFHCDLCPMKFATSWNLTVHKRRHLGITPFPCRYCEKQFTNSSDRQRHELYMHTDERPHKCETCGKSYVKASELSLHALSHADQLPHQCQDCSKQFTTTTALRQHRRLHGEGEMFRCDECGKGFTSAYYLTKHQKVHSEEKPFICALCQFKCNRKDNLDTHVKVHEIGPTNRVCPHCDNAPTFNTLQAFSYHMRHEHSQMVPSTSSDK